MPTVKALTFRAGSGHHETCRQRRGYLERDSRAIDRICLNVSVSERWDWEMDSTRESYQLRGCVNYREFIVSPDAADDASVDQVRELAVRWAKENFPTAEVAIVLHDDNKERIALGEGGIVHAHVVVNTVDLATGMKVVVKDSAMRELHNSAQRIAEEVGLSSLPLYEPGKRLKSEQPRKRTQAERRMEMRGIDSWKGQVRDMALQALSLSDDVGQFRAALDRADVDLYVERGRIYLADRDNPDMRCRADRLDRSLSAKNIAEHFAERQGNPQHEGLVAALKQEIAEGERMHAALIELDRRCDEALEAYRTRLDDGRGISAEKLARALMPNGGTPDELERLDRFRRACENARRQLRDEYGDTPEWRARERAQSESHSQPQRRSQATQQQIRSRGRER